MRTNVFDTFEAAADVPARVQHNVPNLEPWRCVWCHGPIPAKPNGSADSGKHSGDDCRANIERRLEDEDYPQEWALIFRG